MKKFVLLAALSVAGFLALNIGGGYIESHQWITTPEAQKKAETIMMYVGFGLFLLLGFSIIPLFIRLFLRGQIWVGNGEFPPIQFLQKYEKQVRWCVWLFMAVGLGIALLSIWADGSSLLD